MTVCSQQDSVYRAEGRCRGGREFGSADEVEAYIEDLRERYDRWEDDFSDVLFVDVFVHRRGRSRAVVEGDGGVINLNEGQLYEAVVLHELAHVLADSRYGDCGHSPWYARVMLELVYVAMGSEAYSELKNAYDHEGVDHHTDDAGCRSIVL